MKFLEKTWLKVMCYILIPLILLSIAATVIYLEYISYNDEYLVADNFYDTKYFCEIYANILENIEVDYASGYLNYSKGINYWAYNSKGEEYTNYEKYSELVNNKSGYYFNIVNGKAETNLNISSKDISMLEKGAADLTLYSKPVDKISLNNGNMYIEYVLFNIARIAQDIPLYTLPLLILVLVLLIVILIASIGHKKGIKGINMTKIDKLPIEIIFAVIFACSAFLISSIQIIGMGTSTVLENILAVTFLIFAFGIYCGIFMATVSIIIKQIKVGKILKFTLVYRIIDSVYHGLVKNLAASVKVILFILLIIIFSVFFVVNGEIGVVLFGIMWLALMCLSVWYVNRLHEITLYTEKIYNGETDKRLDTHKYIGEMKLQAEYLNDIAGGFSNAVSEKLKSERLKTDLITNVSHDLKTPLTSIINYVDLLKSETIENAKAVEYIGVLDNKANRLKRLTEDLIEASKASSGNIKLNLEKISVDELLSQVLGEFEDKFNKINLEVITKTTKEKLYILADTRYIYRVFENLFENISKYAAPVSRVYIDIENISQSAIITIKNISKFKLNISEDELMERFTRGDRSRNTEGSGLGIAIAKSLTNLQGGNFDLKVDGDLFKVEISFKIIN